MNKKIKKNLAAVMIVGVVTVGSLGTVAYATGNSYDNFKTAVVETIKTDNMTVSASVQMKQNGVVIADGQTIMQKSGNEAYSNSSFIINDNTISNEQSIKDGVIISHQDDKYFSTTIGDRYNNKSFEKSPNMIKLMEMTTDLLVGDVKNQFVSNGDTITVNLTDAQIPELANVAVAAFTEMNGNFDSKRFNHGETEGFEKDFDLAFPITQQAKIKNVSVSALVNDGKVTKMDINFVLAGLDKDGNTVTIDTTVNSSISEIGSTIPQQIDITGEEVLDRDFSKRDK